MLRPYQMDAVNGIRKHYLSGTRKVLLHLATGGGKTVVFCHILKAMAERGKTGLMVVHGRQLVDQAAARLEREGVPHGVIMAGRRTAMNKPVYVCSIDTLKARNLTPPADLVVIDEAHMACSPSYEWLLESYPRAYVLGVTATPFTTKSMRHFADAVVCPITIKDLIDTGFLVPPRYVVPPAKFSLDDVKVDSRTGDYNANDLAEVMGKPTIYGDIASHWVKFAQGRPTLAFCSRVDKSRELAAYLSGQGIRSVHCDAETPESERKLLIAKLEARELDIICNVGIFCTGVDIPPLSCVIMARPTKSLNLYIQQAGRGTRIFEGKKDFILLDHAKNVEAHGFLTTEHEVFLDGMPKNPGKAPPVKACPQCYAACAASAQVCPECGFVFSIGRSEMEQEDANLRELTDADRLNIEVLEFIKEMKRKRKAMNYKAGWVYFTVKAKYGEQIANKYLPKRVVPSWVSAKAY